MNQWKTEVEHIPSATPIEPTLEESTAFAPRNRPSYPRLIILDDGRSDGEIVRIRRPSLTLGRSGCDVAFPAEGMMSAIHTVVVYTQISSECWSWMLEDKSSRNGVYLRQNSFEVRPAHEFLMGGTRVRIHGDAPPPKHSIANLPFIQPWRALQAEISAQREVELLPYLFATKSQRIPLKAKQLTLGRQAAGSESLVVDPFVEPLHARLERTNSGTLNVTDCGSLNGLWLRVSKACLQHGSMFLLGEQRFRFELD